MYSTALSAELKHLQVDKVHVYVHVNTCRVNDCQTSRHTRVASKLIGACSGCVLSSLGMARLFALYPEHITQKLKKCRNQNILETVSGPQLASDTCTCK